MSDFADKPHIIDILLADGDRPLRDVLHRDAFGERAAAAARRLSAQGMIHGGIELDLDTHHFDLRLDMLGRHRDPGNDPAAADRHDDAIETGLVFEHLDADRALPGDDLVVVIGVDEDVALLLDHRLGGHLAVGQCLARKHDLGAMRPRALDLGRRRRLRHDDDRRDAELARVIGNRLRVVAGRHGDHPARPLGRGQIGHLVEGAAILERTGDLQVLEFDVDLRAGDLRELVGMEQGGAHHIARPVFPAPSRCLCRRSACEPCPEAFVFAPAF